MRVVIITGASSGIGLAAATALAKAGTTPIMVGRDPKRLAAAVAQVREAGGAAPDAYRADFARLDEVRELAATITQRYDNIDVLANNAGGLVRARQTTVDGNEATMQVNHLAGFLLTHLLRPLLKPSARIVNTSSLAHVIGRLDPRDLRATQRQYWDLGIYSDAKQANILFTREAAKRWSDLVPTCFHPGIVRTRFGHGTATPAMLLPPWFTPKRGADTLVWLATDPAAAQTPGGYFARRKLRTPAPNARDDKKATELWEASRQAVGLPIYPRE